MAKQQPPMNLDLSTAQDVVCDNCGNYTFNEVVLMKRVSALVSPTGKEAIVPIPTFACNACGFINKQFLPVKMAEQTEETRSETPRIKLEK
jgi:uncharacterized Zn finger protein